MTKDQYTPIRDAQVAKYMEIAGQVGYKAADELVRLTRERDGAFNALALDDQVAILEESRRQSRELLAAIEARRAAEATANETPPGP